MIWSSVRARSAISGAILLLLALSFGFSGYLLPMDELSYFATKVGLEIPASIPVIGPATANLLRGGPSVGEDTVHRFFALHVVALPIVLLALVVLHLLPQGMQILPQLFHVEAHRRGAPPHQNAQKKRPGAGRQGQRNAAVNPPAGELPDGFTFRGGFGLCHGACRVGWPERRKLSLAVSCRRWLHMVRGGNTQQGQSIADDFLDGGYQV